MGFSAFPEDAGPPFGAEDLKRLSQALPAPPSTLITGSCRCRWRCTRTTDSHTIQFHQLQRGTSDRIRNRRVNERTGREVELEEIVKGFDTGEEYVLVEPKELDEVAPGRSQTIEISGFVDLDTVDPIFFDKTYYLGPGAESTPRSTACWSRPWRSPTELACDLRDARARVPRRPQGGEEAAGGAHAALVGRDPRPPAGDPRPCRRPARRARES
ncbi:Ku protein [Streptomyces sp. NPDC004244]